MIALWLLYTITLTVFGVGAWWMLSARQGHIAWDMWQREIARITRMDNPDPKRLRTAAAWLLVASTFTMAGLLSLLYVQLVVLTSMTWEFANS